MSEPILGAIRDWTRLVYLSARLIAGRWWWVVPVIPLLPGGMTEPTSRAAVYQQLGWHERAPGPAVTLPTPSRSVVGAFLEGRMPLRSRWVKAWRSVWDLPWA